MSDYELTCLSPNEFPILEDNIEEEPTVIESKQFISTNNIDACFIYVEKDDTLTFMTNGMLKLISPESPDYSDLQPSLGAAPQ